MTRYANHGGDSGVVSYEIGSDRIKIQFTTGPVYVYTHAATGQAHVETMKQLAVAGEGLNAYVNRYAKKSYSHTE